MFGVRSCIVKQTRLASIINNNSQNVRSIYSKFSEEDKPPVKKEDRANADTHFTSNQKAKEVSQISHKDSEVQKLKIKVGKSFDKPRTATSPISLLDHDIEKNYKIA